MGQVSDSQSLPSSLKCPTQPRIYATLWWQRYRSVREADVLSLGDKTCSEGDFSADAAGKTSENGDLCAFGAILAGWRGKRQHGLVLKFIGKTVSLPGCPVATAYAAS